MSAAKVSLSVAAVIASAVSAGFYTYNFERHLPLAQLADGTLVRQSPDNIALCFSAKLASGTDRNATRAWARCEKHLSAHGSLQEFNRDFIHTVASGAVGAVAFAGLLGLAWTAERQPRHLRGPRKYRGHEAKRRLSHILNGESKRWGRGLGFPPGCHLSRERESRHFMITGGVGAGKTQAMRHLILAAIRRGDQVLVLDTKGDMTAGIPGDIVLLAPQDDRSAAWAVAQDCVSRQDARELAARFIPKSDDPMWSEAARSILAACVISLQAEKPGSWTWADLYARTIMEPEVLQGLARKFYPAASHFLADPASKTSMSILTTFKAHLPTIEALADAWGKEMDRAFPVSSWLNEENGTVPVILQRDGRYPELSNAWISSLVGLLASHIGSPRFTESRSRRVWLFLDEFPQLERMDDFSTLLDLGRSKGICVVLAAQDTSQIRARYGRDRTSAWLSMVGTHIVSRMNVGEGAEDVSRSLGMIEIEVPVRTRGYSGGQSWSSTSVQTRTQPVMTASEISGELGPRDKHVRVLIVGVGQDYYVIDIPYCSFGKEREPHQPAMWTLAPPKRIVPPEPELPPLRTWLSDSEVSKILGKKKRDPD